MEGPGNGPLRRGTTLLHGARIAATVVVVVGSQCMELPAGMNAIACNRVQTDARVEGSGLTNALIDSRSFVARYPPDIPSRSTTRSTTPARRYPPLRMSGSRSSMDAGGGGAAAAAVGERRPRGRGASPPRDADPAELKREVSLPMSLCRRVTQRLPGGSRSDRLRGSDAYATNGWTALGDPTRRAVLQRLVERPYTVTELASELPVSRPAFSLHLKALKDAGLVDRQTVSRRTHLPPAATGCAR